MRLSGAERTLEADLVLTLTPQFKICLSRQVKKPEESP